MADRIGLQTIFENILGSRNVYYQPPPSIKINYPAIVYQRSNVAIKHADNKSYKKDRYYMVTLIDKDPESPYIDSLLDLPYCDFDRHYVADNLNHDVFTIYY